MLYMQVRKEVDLSRIDQSNSAHPEYSYNIRTSEANLHQLTLTCINNMPTMNALP